MQVRLTAKSAASPLLAAIGDRRLLALLIKRAIDVICAALLVVVLMPLLGVLALLVLMSSPGPVLFKQHRVGRDGKLFHFYKFRTMYYGSDESVHRTYYQELIEGRAAPMGRLYKYEADPRVTPIGRVLRRYSLDEFPQLWNVINGDMSLVGPRPPIPYEVQLYGSRELGRLSATPGITGLWQVSGRSTLSFQEMIDLDLAYIDRWSLGLDLKILVRTPWAVINHTGAC
jgi:lipopolysaccharide/colanic/teichoic acid biosynthesis glycosyltransferase